MSGGDLTLAMVGEEIAKRGASLRLALRRGSYTVSLLDRSTGLSSLGSGLDPVEAFQAALLEYDDATASRIALTPRGRASGPDLSREAAQDALADALAVAGRGGES